MTLKPFNTDGTTARLEMGLSGEAIGKLTESHAMPWYFLLFSNSTAEKIVFSQGILTPRDKPQS